MYEPDETPNFSEAQLSGGNLVKSSVETVDVVPPKHAPCKADFHILESPTLIVWG